MIELTKYDKVFTSDQLDGKAPSKEESLRSKLLTTTILLALFSVVMYSVSICYTRQDPNVFNLNLYEKEARTPEMQAYLNFISTYGKAYANMNETASRYRIFKKNYQQV